MKESLHLIQRHQAERGGGRGRDRGTEHVHTNWEWLGLLKSQSPPSVTHPPTRPHFLILSKEFYQPGAKHSQVEACGGHSHSDDLLKQCSSFSVRLYCYSKSMTLLYRPFLSSKLAVLRLKGRTKICPAAHSEDAGTSN